MSEQCKACRFYTPDTYPEWTRERGVFAVPFTYGRCRERATNWNLETNPLVKETDSCSEFQSVPAKGGAA